MEFLTVKQAASRLQVHPETIRRMIRRGDLPFIRVGNVYRVDPQDIHTRSNPRAQHSAPLAATPLSRFVSREWREQGKHDDAPDRRRGG